MFFRILSRRINLLITIIFFGGLSQQVNGEDIIQGEPCTLQQVAELSIIENSTNALLVSVSVNNAPAIFMIDTGAFWSIIKPRLTIGLPSYRAGYQLVAASGGKLDHYTIIPSLQLERFLLKNKEFFVGAESTQDDDQLAGMLGSDLLSHFDIEIDPSRSKVTLFGQRHCRGQVVYWPQTDAVRIPFKFNKNWINIPVLLDGKPLRAIIDTGATDSLLDADFAEQELNLIPNEDEELSSSITADGKNIQIYRHQFETLQIGALKFSNPVIAIENRKGKSQKPKRLTSNSWGLLIGMRQLKMLHLYIAYSEEALYVSTVKGDEAARNDVNPAHAGAHPE